MKLSKVAKFILLISLLASVNLITIVPAKASLDTSQAEYYEEVKSVLSLSPEQEEMLEKYGFVVVELLNNSDTYEEWGFNPALRFEDFYY